MQKTKLLFIAFLSLVLFYACSKESASAESNSVGKGGSLARFTILGNYLYVADEYTIEVFDIRTPGYTTWKSSIPVGFGVETIFPYKDKLFIGSMDGMYIFS